MALLHFTMTVTGTVNTDGGDSAASHLALSEAELAANLVDAVSHITGAGMVTGDSPATLDVHAHTVRVVGMPYRMDAKDLSSVVEEVDAMDWQFSELGRLISDLEKQPSASSREFIAKQARRRLDTLVQRAFRARQVSMGMLVHKAN